MVFTYENQIVTVLQPIGDRYNTDPATDVISLAKYGHATFLIAEGAGGTGTVKIEVEACDDLTPSNAAAMAFNYRVATSGDTWGALTASAATGYTTTAGANKMIAVEVDASELPAGYPCCRLQLTEVADDPCDAAVFAILSQPRNAHAVMPSAIA